jgi:hypothetical protein
MLSVGKRVVAVLAMPFTARCQPKKANSHNPATTVARWISVRLMSRGHSYLRAAPSRTHG